MMEETPQPLYTRPWLWLIAIAVGAGMVYLIVRTPSPRPPMQQALIEAVHDELGMTVTWHDELDRLQGFNLGKRGPDAYLLWLYWRAHNAPDNERIRRSMLRDAQTLLQRLSTDAAFDSIQTYRLMSFLMMPDSNGMLQETAAARFVLTQDAARPIRWDTLTPEGFIHLLRTNGEIRFHRTLR